MGLADPVRLVEPFIDSNPPIFMLKYTRTCTGDFSRVQSSSIASEWRKRGKVYEKIPYHNNVFAYSSNRM